MIPQAITKVGPNADLWSHLKSIQFALKRSLAVESGNDLSVFDKERLRLLAGLFKNELSTSKAETEKISFAGFGGQTTPSADYTLDIDLSELLKDLKPFKDWQSSQKLGFEKKWKRLIGIICEYLDYLDNQDGKLLPRKPPTEEFRIISFIVDELLLNAESSLQS
ncbi:MAG: hypothetical protein KDN19_12280 [Verrucomicrobiae bacterium]|nr:hypothetical protein [Verrucomicrobiae bacterium]